MCMISKCELKEGVGGNETRCLLANEREGYSRAVNAVRKKL